MKIDVKEATVISNVPQDNVTNMSISADGMEHIMSLLTNLYKDPELAVIREYYTNALDAHVAAGVVKPVLVTIPSWDSPIYIVQDFGVGMSKDDITNIYAQYGASTKRNTNDQVGAFGLGCKSALTIATQFTLVSVKNGMKTTALIAKSASGINTVNIISNIDTSEPNGTTVKIPVSSRVWDFDAKARSFFAYSTPGSVLVDGKEPEYILSSAEKVVSPDDSDCVAFLRPRGDGESQVIMGNVPYALSNTEIELSMSRLGMDTNRGFVRMPKYFPVPIGSVDLTPSREGLRFTDKTNAAIDARMKFILQDLKDIAQAELDGTTNLHDFFASYKRWQYIVDIKRQWNGEDVPLEIQVKDSYRSIKRSLYSAASHTESTWFRLDRANYNEETVVVKGYGADAYKKVNNYLTPYMAAENLDSLTFIITDDADFFTDKWVAMLEDFTYVDGDDIIAKGKEQRKKERAAAAKVGKPASKNKIKYPVLFVDEKMIRWVSYDLITKGTPYIRSGEVGGDFQHEIKYVYDRVADRKVGDNVINYLTSITDEKEIVLLNNNRTVKALRDRIKTTRSLESDFGKAVEKSKKLITEDMVRHHAVALTRWKRFLVNTGIDKKLSKIKDTQIAEVVVPSQSTLAQYDVFNASLKALNYFRYNAHWNLPTIDTANLGDLTQTLDKKYPLVGALDTWRLDTDGVDHLIKYFNVIHEESTP